MDILATGVQRDEREPLERAFDERGHKIRSLELFLNADTAPLAEGHEVISTFVSDELDAEVLRVLHAGGTRMIAQRSTGYNNIDVEAAAELGMTVARVSQYSPYAVAEHAWTLATAVNRKIVRAATRAREFDFRLDRLMGRDLHGMTVGVLGTGKIGEIFARIGNGYGCRLLGWDIRENPACLALGMEYVERDQLFAEADLISLHVPLLPDTHHVVNATTLRRMRDDAILVNTSRGGLVDANALVDTLRQGRLAGVGLDVYEEEAGLFFYDRSDQAFTDETLALLMSFNRVLVTSHQAYFTATAVGQIIEATVGNVEDYLAGRTGENMLARKSG
jgi:D-lactate dehydrogenase